MTVVVEVVRSGFVESRHHGSVIAVDRDGQAVLDVGETRIPVFGRSANKPLQAVGMLRAGLDLDGELLALAASSHSGQPVHLAGVRRILAAAGLDESALGNVADWPLDDVAREDTLRASGQPSRLAMNCSGKHAAMLLTCVRNGWDVESYLDPAHPLQVALTAAVEDLAGEQVRHVGVDGCGAPVLALTLAGLARAFGRLAAAGSGPERLVADAMRAHPRLVGGDGRDVTELMSGVKGLLAKDGAEGVYAAGLPDGSALAVKIEDGGDRARGPVVVAALRALGVQSAVLDRLATGVVLGGGRPVGELRLVALTGRP